MLKNIELTVTPEYDGKRLDTFLSEAQGELSRSQIQKLIADGRVRIGGVLADKAGIKVNSGSIISLEIPEKKKLDLTPVDLSLEIIYEDDDLAVINKPANLSVHPSTTETSATMVHGLLHQLRSLSGVGGVERPGIVHRIDKGTSGLLVVSKNDRTHEFLAKKFAAHTIARKYVALVYGDLSKKGKTGTVATYFGRHPKDRKKMTGKLTKGRRAITHWSVQKIFRVGKTFFTLVECRLETGRTHQIRVHLCEAGFPIVGDPVYGDSRNKEIGKTDVALEKNLKEVKHQLLHAQALGFEHPAGSKTLSFEAPLPKDFENVLTLLSRYEI